MHNNFAKLEIPVVTKLCLIYEKTHPLIFKFPKHERYVLGEKIESSILESMELLVIASQTPKCEKERMLVKANAKIEILKILFRISLNCLILETEKYLEIESDLQESGKMIQGWIKYTRDAV